MRFAMCILMAVVATGCASRRHLTIALINATGQEVQEAEVVYDRHQAPGGVLVVNAMASSVYNPWPVGEAFTVRWGSADGQRHKVRVPTKAVLPVAEDSELCFRLLPDDSVRVYEVTDADAERSIWDKPGRIFVEARASATMRANQPETANGSPGTEAHRDTAADGSARPSTRPTTQPADPPGTDGDPQDLKDLIDAARKAGVPI